MPLLAGALAPPPPPAPPVIRPQGTRDAAQARWIAPDGSVWPLTQPDLGWFTLDAVTGLGAAPINVSTDAAPRGGTTVRHVQPQARLITWAMHVGGETTTEFLDRYRRLARAFTMTRRRGPGRLIIRRSTGEEREILAWYQEGFDGQPGAGHLWDDFVLTLYCPDPYFRAVEPLVEAREQGTTATHLSPYPYVSSGQVLGQTTLYNPGDVEAWPSWSIRGPATLITVANNTTGESFVVNPNAAALAHGNLLTGEVVTVETEPPSVRGPAGQVWTAALNFPGATLFALDPGDNAVTFTADGSGPGTRVALSFHPRYETA